MPDGCVFETLRSFGAVPLGRLFARQVRGKARPDPDLASIAYSTEHRASLCSGVAVRKLARLTLVASIALSSSAAFSSETITYSYDARGRLVQSVRAGGANAGVSSSYTYDKADNRSNVTVAGVLSAPSFSISDASATEGGSIVFTINKAGAANVSFSVNYATADGSAVAGADYTATSGTLIFGPSETAKTVTVATIDDALVEGAEAFYLNLSNPTGGAAISRNQGVATINDNDAPPPCQGVSFTIASNGAVTEGGSSIFTVTKSGSATGACSVNYGSGNGSALAGSDFNAVSGTLTFAASETSKSVTVTTIDDTTVESAENFSMSLSSPTGGAVVGSPGSAVGTINDNDVPPPAVFTIADASQEEGMTMVFTVTRSGTTNTAVSVNYATANGLAVASSDYYAVSGTLSFAANETSKTVSVVIRTDLLVEGSEAFYVNLSSPSSGATIGDGQAIGTIIDTSEPQCFDSGGRPIPCD